MTWQDFSDTNEIEYTENRITETEISFYEKEMGVPMGPQLREYLLNYGYIAFLFVELYGINSIQKENSDMVKQTKFLHEQFPLTKDLIVLEDQGDGDYYLVDHEDVVYRYIMGSETVSNQEIKLFEYITKRFEDIKRLV